MEHDELKVPDPEALRLFWQVHRSRARLVDFQEQLGTSVLGTVMPGAWAYGATASEADAFVRAVVEAGSATVHTPLADYAEDDLPLVGTMSILCTGSGAPAVLMVVEHVEIDEDSDPAQVSELLRVLVTP